MPSIPNRTEWSSHEWLRLTTTVLGLLVILVTGGTAGTGGTTDPGVWHGAVLIENDDIGDAQEPRLAGSQD